MNLKIYVVFENEGVFLHSDVGLSIFHWQVTISLYGNLSFTFYYS